MDRRRGVDQPDPPTTRPSRRLPRGLLRPLSARRGSGFGVHRELFKSAGWRTIAGETALEIDLDGVTLSAVRYDYEDAEVTLTDDRAAGFGGHAGLT
jgi:hypothetical protein